MNESLKLISLGAVGAWVFGAAADVIVYAAGIAAILGVGVWVYATAVEEEEDDD